MKQTLLYSITLTILFALALVGCRGNQWGTCGNCGGCTSSYGCETSAPVFSQPVPTNTIQPGNSVQPTVVQPTVPYAAPSYQSVPPGGNGSP